MISFGLVLTILFSAGKGTPVEISRDAANSLVKTLGKVLKKEITQRGVVDAINVCSDTAQVLLQEIRKKYQGIYIRRTSLKWRNPADIPTPDEVELLKRLQRMSEEGNLPGEVIDTVLIKGRKVFRYARVLKVKGLCLRCHGENIKPEVKSILEKKYIHDSATGYKIGDFRGIVVVKIPLQ